MSILLSSEPLKQQPHVMLAKPVFSEDAAVDDVVQVSLSSLISLNRPAATIPLLRTKIRASQSGGYLSKTKGRGMEFDESRPYMPGDDVRSLDWRVTARSGRAHTKLFREERERPVLLAIDLCQSMFFATRGTFKSVLAVRLAALLAWSAHLNGDRVGGQIFGQSDYRECKPQTGRSTVLHLLKMMVDLSNPATDVAQVNDLPAKSEGSLNQALVRLSRHAKPGTLAIFISDFRQFNTSCEYHLMRLARHCDIYLLLVYDLLEAELPVNGLYRFSDGNRFVTINTSDDAATDRYRQSFIEHRQKLKDLASRYRMGFAAVRTNDDPLKFLQSNSVNYNGII